MKSNLFLIIMAISLAACKNKDNVYDASGTFEAVETIVSAEATGRIMALNIEEGQLLKVGQNVGYIDSVQLYLKKKQLEAQIRATGSRLPDIVAQTNVYKQQEAVTQVRLDNLLYEQKRIRNLLKADAATPKQLDDITAQIKELQKQLDVIRKQDAAQASVLKTQTSGLRADVLPLYVQIEQINDQLAKSKIVNEVNGTVLSKYAETNEMAVSGKPLYKVADLSTIILRAYVTGDQLAKIKLNQKVKVLVDDADDKYRELGGEIEWISSKAEFTPKTIQTKDERANLVYALKIRVKNDGFLKIGMYGEVVL
ncbi:HlyD family secretion protein [Dyadobacter bucti]|uniref:HlyD family secretion protein n=1 Tax=Dyadobacter bucti TaxID=2572203 RepID=UPI003F6E86B4